MDMLLVIRLCEATGKAEGWGVPNAIPTKANNPGDLCLGDRFGLGVLGTRITIFPKADMLADINDQKDGYSALKREWVAILTGKSHIYGAEWTIQEVANHWTATNPDDWARIVAGQLGVPASTPLNKLSGLLSLPNPLPLDYQRFAD